MNTMDQLIQILIYVVLFAIAAYGLWWVCEKFTLPQPILWICGAILVIVILFFVARQLGAPVNLFPVR